MCGKESERMVNEGRQGSAGEARNPSDLSRHPESLCPSHKGLLMLNLRPLIMVRLVNKPRSSRKRPLICAMSCLSLLTLTIDMKAVQQIRRLVIVTLLVCCHSWSQLNAEWLEWGILCRQRNGAFHRQR